LFDDLILSTDDFKWLLIKEVNFAKSLRLESNIGRVFYVLEILIWSKFEEGILLVLKLLVTTFFSFFKKRLFLFGLWLFVPITFILFSIRISFTLKSSFVLFKTFASKHGNWNFVWGTVKTFELSCVLDIDSILRCSFELHWLFMERKLNTLFKFWWFISFPSSLWIFSFLMWTFTF
jgi:hypothetical protein